MRVAIEVEALFIDLHAGALGRRFALHRAPRSARVQALAVYVHPFAEEMNKSRRMAMLQATALANAGWAVLQIDLLGCGDSAGEFADARWDEWVDDVVQACHWLQRRHAATDAPLWLWGLRSGCLLAAAAAALLGRPVNFLFWQPPVNGQMVLQQFLRLKLASELIAGQGKGTMQALHRSLASGAAVDVAGYRLSPALADGLARATLQAPKTPGQVEWLELSSREDASLSPATGLAAARWREAGHALHTHVVNGAAFWQSTEIECVPALLAASTGAATGTAKSPADHGIAA